MSGVRREARVSNLEVIGKSGIKETIHLKGEIGMFIDIGQSPEERGLLNIQERVLILSPLCIHKCFKIISPGLKYSFTRN